MFKNVVMNCKIESEKDVIDYLKTKLKLPCEVSELNGGLLNRFENKENSTIRIKSDKNYILKIKNPNKNIANYFIELFKSNQILSENYVELLKFLSFLPSFKEIKIYEYLKKFHNEMLTKVAIMGKDENSGNSFILMEDLTGYTFYEFLCVEKIVYAKVDKAIENLAVLHNFMFANSEYLEFEELREVNLKSFRENDLYFQTLGASNLKRFEGKIKLPTRLINILNNLYEEIDLQMQEMDKGFKILVHNDFNIRNTCFSEKGGEIGFKIFDWDLASVQNPEFDFVEYILFLYEPLKENEFENLVKKYIEMSKFLFDKDAFRRLVRANIIWFVGYKYCIYGLIEGLDVKFLARMGKNIDVYLSYLESNY